MRYGCILLALLLLLTGCAPPSSGQIDWETSSSTLESHEASQSSEPEPEPESSSSEPEMVISISVPSSSKSDPSESEEPEPSSEPESSSSESSVPEESASSLPLEASEVESSEPEPPSESSQSSTPGFLSSESSAPPEESSSAASNSGGLSVPTNPNAPRDTVADETEIFNRINSLRANLGLPTLTLHQNLLTAARLRAKEFALYDLQDHIRPNGDDWVTVLQKDVPVAFRYAAENVAGVRTDYVNYTGAEPADYVDMWVNSPSHYEAMVSKTYTHMAVGVYVDIDPDGVWRCYSVTLFASF